MLYYFFILVQVLHVGCPFERALVVVACAVQAGVQNCVRDVLQAPRLSGYVFFLAGGALMGLGQFAVRVARDPFGCAFCDIVELHATTKPRDQ